MTQTYPVQRSQPQSSSSRYVIVNGDDFGFSSGVNQAILTAHQKGILTSTSLMVTGEAFDQAVELAKANPSLAIGLHLVLCCGRSTLPPNQIPHLVNEHGEFSNDPTVAGLRYQFSRAAQQEVALEIRAQLEKFRQTGLPLSHVDGHLHLHCHPIVLRSLAALSAEFGIRVIRLPSEELRLTLGIDSGDWQTKLIWATVFGGLRRYGEGVLRSHNIRYAERVYGLLQTARMTESYLLQLIPQIRANVVEIYSHPALQSESSNSGLGFAELEALMSDRVRETLIQNGFELTNYHNQSVFR